MNDELDKKLCEKYPKIFKDRYADMRTTAMCWGFETGPGWYTIIDKLCNNIQHHIDWSRKQRLSDLIYNRALKKALNGDNSGLIKFFSYGGKVTEYTAKTVEQEINRATYRTPAISVPQVVAEQVKEKFGGLRFYYRGGDRYIEGLVTMAESMSYATCEECGNPGKPNKIGWIRTLCTTHRPEPQVDE